MLAWRRERTPTRQQRAVCYEHLGRVGKEEEERKGSYEGEGEAQEGRDGKRGGFERFCQPAVGGAPHKIMRGKKERVGRTNSCASFAATDKEIRL